VAGSWSLVVQDVKGEGEAISLMPKDVPPAFHLLAKPAGAICNLNCKYCFYLSKEAL
jgi:uncharacterized protein